MAEVEGRPVQVEMDLAVRLSDITIVWFPDSITKDICERINAAISNSGYALRIRRAISGLLVGTMAGEAASTGDDDPGTGTFVQ